MICNDERNRLLIVVQMNLCRCRVGFCLTGVKGRVEVCRVRRTPKENGCGFTALFLS